MQCYLPEKFYNGYSYYARISLHYDNFLRAESHDNNIHLSKFLLYFDKTNTAC